MKWMTIYSHDAGCTWRRWFSSHLFREFTVSPYWDLLIAVALSALTACDSSPLRQTPPAMPEAYENVMADAANGGRVRSIAVNPVDVNNAIIATEFGGMWRTYNAGKTWFRIYSLPAVYVTDVEYGADGKTVVATVFRDNQTQNGGGIYVSHTNGDFWSRPPTGIVPMNNWYGLLASAYSVSHAPDEPGLWYVGTVYGIAVSHDNGATWAHTDLNLSPGVPTSGAHSVLAFPGGSVLAMTNRGVFRSDDRGSTWRVIVVDDFTAYAPTDDGNVGQGGNKMDRVPDKPWAFLFKEYHHTPDDPRKGGGQLWFYELDTDTKTLLELPQGNSRGPFVRVSRDLLNFGGYRVWMGEGWDGYYVNRRSAADFRGLLSNATWDDWVSFIAEAGIHADMGDLGLDRDGFPAYLGSDGGIFKPRPQANWWEIGGAHKWMSAAAPGSGFNSLQISDLGGTNFHLADGSVRTSLYITTQDNSLYVSLDGGQTWKVGDLGEGFGIEVRPDASAGESAQVAFVSINGGILFSDADFTHTRAVPNVDENGNALDSMERPFFVSQQGNGPSNWVRLRNLAPNAIRQAYYSNDSGATWHQFATINFASTGELRTVGTVSWLPVFLGGTARVGLLPLNTSIAPGGAPPIYDDSDAVSLPGNGSIGRRFTEWDTHAVYGVHATNWAYLIAPDIAANDMKYTYDGGKTWRTSAGLTAEVLKGGALMMWGGKPDLMEVTEIAFDPYQPGRILVGTRDAGIVCTADDGRTWRTVYDSDKINYITAFFFQPSGSVYISSYGHGLWQMNAAKGCPKTYSFPWDQPPDVSVTLSNAGAIARTVPPPTPRGIAFPNNPKLFLTFEPARGAPDDYLTISGRGFPASQEIALRCREIESLAQTTRVDKAGQFSARLRLPANLPHGVFTIEATLKASQRSLTSAQFTKAYSDEGAPKSPSRAKDARRAAH